MKLHEIYAKDWIALAALTMCFYLLSIGKDSFVAACTTLILGYYFTHRERLHVKR